MSTLSLADCIERLGGTAAVARACGVSVQAVSNWKPAGAVPPRHAMRLWAMAKRAGLPWWPDGMEGFDLVLPEEDPGPEPPAAVSVEPRMGEAPAPAGVEEAA
jgi:transcriptional regulator with XRE-family HTH domain